MRVPTEVDLVEALRAELAEQDYHCSDYGGGHDFEGPNAVVVDGMVDLAALARVILKMIQEPE